MKGNLLIAHGGGPTPVINASLYGVITEALRHPEQIGKVFGAFHGIEGVLKNQLFDLTSEPSDQIELLLQTPSSIIGSCRHKVTESEYPLILENLRKNNIRYFIYNGGNDSMDTCHKISKLAEQCSYELQVVGIPKTIDNDLGYTDNCPGYGSAARFIANNTRDLWMEAQALPLYVNIYETMGRNAGWLTAAASLAEYNGKPCAQLIYLPEVKLNIDRFLSDVDNQLHKGREILIVVSEGLVDSDGASLMEETEIIDEFGHRLPGGVGNTLCKYISKNLKVRARAEKHGFLGRCSAILQFKADRDEAVDVGKQAVRYLMQGKNGIMVTIERCESPDGRFAYCLGEVALEKVANYERFFPTEWITPSQNGVTEAFRTYARPLIGEPFPDYTVLKSFIG